MEADKMLDVYIHDYLIKRNFGASARTFEAEAQVVTNRTAMDAPGSCLLEWWSVFWDIFIARFKTPVSTTNLQQKDVQRQMQMQELIRQKQQQPGDGTQLLRGRQILGTTNALTKRVQRNPLFVANKKPRSSDSIGQHLDANLETFRDQHSWQTRHSFPADNLRFYPPLTDQAQQLPLPQLDQNLTNRMNPAVTLKAGESGSDHGVNSLLLKGWPLMGLEQLQSGLIQHQSSTINLSHPSQQQLQQQIQMLLSDQYMDISQGDQSNFTGNIVVDRNLPVQVGLRLFSRADSAMLMKNIYQSLEQGQQPAFLGVHPENSSSSIQKQDKRVATGGTTMEVSLSNTSRGDDQKRATKKRKQLMSSGQTNSIGTANNTSLLPSSAPSTPSISSAEDVISMPALLRDDNSSKACVYGNDAVCSATLISTQTADVPLINHGSVDNSVESFLFDNADTESIIPGCLGRNIAFLEIGTFRSSTVNCCDLSSDGKLIANGGDKEVVLWCTDSREQKHILEEHSDAITDVRFSPRLPRLASSSLDKTIKIWNVHNPGYSIRSFTGHSVFVMSLDFHPTKEDLICSCDNGHISNIRAICWSSSGEYLASLSEDMVQVWKIGSSGEQECVHERSVTGKRFRCCTFHPCYPSVFVVGSYQCLELWHMAENKDDDSA